MSTIYSDGYLIISTKKSRKYIHISLNGHCQTTIAVSELPALIEHLQKHVETVENHNALEAMIVQSVAIHGPEKTQEFITNLLKPLKKVHPQ